MTIKKIIKNPRKIVLYLINRKPFFFIKDETYIKIAYKNTFRKKLNLEKPKTFNEKLQWLKLYDRKDLYTIMVDKYEVKKYVANIIGKEYIIPTLGIYEKFDDIDFNKLPNQFVIKCTHDSGGLVIVKDKKELNIKSVKKRINSSLKRNYYYTGREWPYKNVKPRIIIEEYMIDKTNNELRDYKFFCFNGKVKFFKIDFNRFIDHRANYYDNNGNLLEFGEKVCPPDFSAKISLPNNLKEMIKLSEKLSKNTYFLRVDFYEVNNKIYFGELTFFPASGFGEFIPNSWDKKIGDMLELPTDKK